MIRSARGSAVIPAPRMRIVSRPCSARHAGSLGSWKIACNCVDSAVYGEKMFTRLSIMLPSPARDCRPATMLCVGRKAPLDIRGRSRAAPCCPSLRSRRPTRAVPPRECAPGPSRHQGNALCQSPRRHTALSTVEAHSRPDPFPFGEDTARLVRCEVRTASARDSYRLAGARGRPAVARNPGLAQNCTWCNHVA